MRPLIFLFILIFYSSFSLGKVDHSSDIFFPKKMGEKLKSYQSTPLSWWNFVIYDSEKFTKQQACEKFKGTEESILFNPCNEIPFSKLWLKDVGQTELLSSAPPSNKKELEKRLDRAVLQLSLPISRASLEMVRNSPMTDFSNLGSQFNEFFEKGSEQGRWQMIPLLFNFKPGSNSEVLDQFQNEEAIKFVGPHFGAVENKKIIIQDLKWVIGLGGVLVCLLLFWLFTTGRRPFLLLLPIIAVSMGFAFLITNFIFGSIHGLTLAFGGGLIGISMDYAFHGWQRQYDPKVWRSIFVGYLTSFSAFFLLGFFSTPLIRQLSVFSMAGLTCSYFGIWFLSKKGVFNNRVRPVEVVTPQTPRKLTLISMSLLAVLGIVSAIFIKNDFSLRTMDVTMSKMDSSLNSLNKSKDQWHFIFAPIDQENQVKSLSNWASENNLSSLIFTSFGSPPKTHEGWKSLLCDSNSFWHQSASKAPYEKLFGDFFDQFNCETLNQKVRSPLRDLFTGPNQFISILKSQTPEEAQKILEKYPEQFQISEITKNFPKVLKYEIRNFLLVIVFLSLAILTFFFGNKAALALLPALGGFASILIVHFLFGMNLTFISFVSMIILIGLTIDYGVFCVSHLKWKEPLDKANGAIALSAITSLAGFSPLALCNHPVLRDLGLTLTCGLFGALVVCFFLYPQLDKRTYA